MKCSRCGADDVPLMKYVQAEKKTYYHCRPCNAERLRMYRRTRNGKAATSQATYRYEAKNIERRRAWKRAQSIPLQPCEVCGVTKPVHRHHDDITRPLDVMFLCPAHHKARHRQLKAAEIAA